MKQLANAAKLLASSIPLALATAASAGPHAYTTIDVPGASYTVASDINGAGTIVGTFGDNKGAHGFVYDGSAYRVLDVPGASLTYGYGINDAGNVVGVATSNYASTSAQHGFVMMGAAVTAFDVPGAPFTIPSGINDSGHIVGGYVNGAGIGHGFLKIGNTHADIDVPGPTAYTGAYGINNSGQIVGSFTDAAGDHGFLADSVPEPATVALLIGGLALLFGAARLQRWTVRRSTRALPPPPRSEAGSRRNGIGAALLVGLVLGPAVPAAAALRGAYVEAILPSKPFKLSVTALYPGFPGVRNEDLIFVTGDGAFGITSITVTNTDNVVKTLTVSEPPRHFNKGCGTPVATAVSSFVITVPATSTVHLTFPSPLVFSAINGYTCVGLHINEFAYGVGVLLNGFSN